MQHTETFDDGASLATKGWIDVDSMANTAGAGRNGSYGIVNTIAGQSGEGQLPLRPVNSFMCASFDFMRTGEDTYTTYFFAQYGGYHGVGTIGNMQVGFAIDTDDTTLMIDTSDDGTIDTVAGFWPPADEAWRTCRIEVQASTYSALGEKVANGVVRIWITDETGALTLRYDRTNLMIPDWRGFTENPAALPWSGVLFTAIGAFDNINISDTTCATQPPPPGGQCCGRTGPGGSDPGRDPDDPTNTPRVIPPGGYPPSYVACTGNGTPATASDPANAQTIAGAVNPLVHLQMSLPDATVLRFGQRSPSYTSGNGQTVTTRVISFAPSTYTLADRNGNFQAMRTSVRLSDADGTIRGYLSSATNRYIDGREAVILIETAANAALAVAPRVLARGVITNWKTTPTLDVDIEIMDPLGYRYSSVSLDRPIPHRVFRPEIFPDCPEHVRGQPVPIIYGEYSDDYTWSTNAARTPAGITPVYYVGRAYSIPGLSAYLPEDHWHAFVVCGHAIAGVQSWFASNDHPDGPASVRMDPGTEGVDFLIPNEAGWDARLPNPYVDVVGTDGVTERFTMIFARGPRAQHAVDGEVPITLNICGLEDIGDGTGEIIDDMAYQMQHFLCYFVLQNYTSGSWGAVPTFAGGTPKVRTSSFDTVRAVHDVRVSGGYRGALYIGTQRTAREHLSEMQRTMDIRLGVNNHGQIFGFTFNDGASTAGLTTFTATTHNEQSVFNVDPMLDGIVNVISSEHGFEAGTGFTAGARLTLRSATSITRHGERIYPQVQMIPTRIAPVAWDITARQLLRWEEAMALVRFRVDLRGVDLSIGQLVQITDFRGIGSSGWTTRVVLVTKVTTNPSVGDMLCDIEAEDVHDLLVTNALFGNVGLEADSSAAVVGSEVSGTAYRVG